MTSDWLIACLIGAGKLFLHPLFYLSILLSCLIGYLRVKRERRMFTAKVFPVTLEIRSLFSWGILLGILLSILTLGIGIVITWPAVIVMGALSILLSWSFKLLSPAYTAGITFFLLYFLQALDIEIPYLQSFSEQMNDAIYPALALLIGLLIIAEGVLIQKNAAKNPSPHLKLSSRGQPVGVYLSKRLWMVPMFVLLPGEGLSAIFDWYPVFTAGETSFTPLLLPYMLGFSQQVKGRLPEEAIRTHGRLIITLGAAVTAAAILSYWTVIAAIAAAGIAVLGRALIAILQNAADRKSGFYFSKSSKGVKVLGVYPNSPADKMGLKKGEVISKINGTKVKDESEFYLALQKNRAHCKLEVIGTNGQMRFVQRALFEGEHYELGVLFIEGFSSSQIGSAESV
ncbi:PDZ domain-containing protein [Bacillus massiliglaciei]|uniref:PDZ domain-containing protein n=1 Tax=Bacillus massiliglaciei TaxID=1816693 RepID=UPI000DA60EAD|nr:PDZ domain-containing protein [Bacillus massiliglaciei]